MYFPNIYLSYSPLGVPDQFAQCAMLERLSPPGHYLQGLTDFNVHIRLARKHSAILSTIREDILSKYQSYLR